MSTLRDTSRHGDGAKFEHQYLGSKSLNHQTNRFMNKDAGVKIIHSQNGWLNAIICGRSHFCGFHRCKGSAALLKAMIPRSVTEGWPSYMLFLHLWRRKKDDSPNQVASCLSKCHRLLINYAKLNDLDCHWMEGGDWKWLKLGPERPLDVVKHYN